jgi:hypothetical protein
MAKRGRKPVKPATGYAFHFDPGKPLMIRNAKEADPHAIGNFLTQVAKENGGRLKAGDAVVAAERGGRERHVAGKHLTWDDSVAGHRWRETEMRELISIVRMTDVEEPEKLRPAFLSVADEAGRSYRTLSEVLNSSSLQMRVLECAERDLKAWEARYRSLGEICDVVAGARHRIAERRVALESRPQ